MVHISNISTCRVIQKTSNNVECIPVDDDYPVNTDLPIMVCTVFRKTIMIAALIIIIMPNLVNYNA